ncbi:MAG: DNA replication/repair protein RecF [Candidatus Cyclobacteriaceae bacterium M3_2C_046]
MYLQNIKLSNFKNYEEADLSFSPQINCLLGNNGSGKTNLLDAIHYLSLTKSAFNPVDSQNIKHGAPFFFIKGVYFRHDKTETVLCNLKAGQKKTVKINNKPYSRLGEHVGKFPLVMVVPDDQDLVREGSEVRRKFFDNLISQVNQEYLQNLISYYHYLKQRNALLKQFSEKNYFDQDLLMPYNQQIISLGKAIYRKRTDFMEAFIQPFKQHYLNLTSGKESVDLKYQSDLEHDEFDLSFKQNLSKDIALQRTTAGVHRDDYQFRINRFPLKKFGSQGQQKSFVIALKLAKFDLIKQVSGIPPILLLDDIFDKLDESRMNKLMKMVGNQAFGQLFVTDARPERSQKIFKHLGIEVRFYKVDQGNVIEI